MPPKVKKQSPQDKGKTAFEKMQEIERAKEQKSMELFYKLCEPEPEEEPLEQKIERGKRQLKDNTFT